jgi:acetylornithine aminotransferase
MAKPLANGYPIGAVMVRDHVASVMTAGACLSHPPGTALHAKDAKRCAGSHGTTFGGSPLACAAGLHVLKRLSDQKFLAHAAETSTYLLARLERLAEWFPELVDAKVRGRGLILGLVLPGTGHPARLVELARERGLLLLTAGTDCVRLVPSLNVSVAEAGRAVDVIESCLGVMAGEAGAA